MNSSRNCFGHWFSALALVALSGCASVAMEPKVDFPEEAGMNQSNRLGLPETKDWEKEKARQRSLYEQAFNSQSKARPGAIYQKAGFRSIYEDIRAKYVGDMVIVELAENTIARQSKSTSVSRDDSASISLPNVGSINGIEGTASSSKDFNGDGSTSASNLLSGIISTRVIEVLPNGYLRVAGEKQLG
ncbi:MAG: flagellar basal body L-ring protein FlgH, partial [Limnobacter sp.]|nr:flagellar basal body L-ring protein FlgH [Limnobacter sp.]